MDEVKLKPCPIAEAVKVLRSTSAHHEDDDDGSGQSITATRAADALEQTSLARLKDNVQTPEAATALRHRIWGHSTGLKENARYDPSKPSGLTNADAVSYGGFIEEIGAALDASLTRTASLDAQVAALKEALEPFAKAAAELGDDRKVWIERPINDSGELRIEHFVRAAALLNDGGRDA